MKTTQVTEVKEKEEKPERKKITLDNMTWKGYLTMASVGGTLGAIIGKFL